MAVQINEIRIDQPSADDDEYFELFGTSGESLDGLTYLVIGDGTGGSGVVEGVIDLSGYSLDADGYFVAAEATFTLGLADLVTTLNFENSDNVTHLLVSGFTGANGDDLDLDDDGVLDVTPWTTVVDSVAIVEDLADGERVYSDTQVGPDGTFVPGHVYRAPDGGAFEIGSFDLAGGTDTPGAANPAGDGGDGGGDGDGGPVDSTLVINEIDADQSGADSAEFVEIYDGGIGNVSLDGYVVVFFNGSSDTAYEAFDLDGYATDADGYFVLGNPGVANVDLTFEPGSGGALQNGADAVALYLGNAADFPTGTTATTAGLVDAVVYDTNDADDADLLAALGQTQQFNEDAGGAKDTESLSRLPNGSGTFATAAPTPGAANGGTTGTPDPLAVAIYDIQGAAHVSPLLGSYVVTTGSVTAVDTNGFYLQDATGDGDISTSDAVFVFTDPAPAVMAGDAVSVTGTVSEFTPGGTSTGNLSITQISAPTAVDVLSVGNALPEAVLIGPDGRTPPTEVIEDDDFASFDPETDGADFFESVEGMLVTVQAPVAVSATNQYGEIFTVSSDGAGNLVATGVNDRGSIQIEGGDGYLGVTNVIGGDFNPERIQIQADPGFTPGGVPDVNTGAQLGDVTGVVSYAFGNYEVLATEAITVAAESDLVPEISGLTGGDDALLVASYNVLNLDPNDADGDADVADGRFAAIAEDIFLNLNAPDIVALQEVQDNAGSTNDGVTSADQTLQLLVDEIYAVSGIRYEYIDNPFVVDGAGGGQPGANIRTAYLYNPARVEFVEGSLSPLTDVDDYATNPDNPFYGSRLPLAATFEFDDDEITLVNNHFSSKGGSTPLYGTEQPPLNGSADERAAQAQAVNDYVDGLLAADPDARIAVLGDLNEFEFEEPLQILEGDLELSADGTVTDGSDVVLTNLTFLMEDADSYSYSFEGNAQSLDHILVSDALLAGVGIDAVHVNTEFADGASDHDPLLARFVIEDADDEILLGGNQGDELSGGNGDDELIGGNGRDLLFGGADDDLLTGGNGRDILYGDAEGDSPDAGDDVLLGGNGRDMLFGGAGNDILNGGHGADLLTGGADADTFVFERGAGFDTVTDFTAGEDLLDFTDFGLTFGRLDSNGDGILDGGDRGIALTGDALVLSVGGATVALEGITSLGADDLLL